MSSSPLTTTAELPLAGEGESPPPPSSSPTMRFSRELLGLMEHASSTSPEDAALPETSRPSRQNALVQVRLGIASSLFTALRCKHRATAAHSLRVALGCSAWARTMVMPDDQRDELEVAALLHDIGKIGLPDAILRKPGRLSPEETALVNQHWEMGLEILDSCSPSRRLREIVRNAGAWYDGTKPGFTLRANQLPLGSRMLAVVDAFDAMTTDHVYRPAMSRERAVAELFQFAGRQFDPGLVRQFTELDLADQPRWRSETASQWLHSLDATESSRRWRLCQQPGEPSTNSVEELFQRTLFDGSSSAVIWVDSHRQILRWSEGAAKLTGISSETVEKVQWEPSLLDLCDANGRTVPDADCPVMQTIKTRVAKTRRYQFWARRSHQITVDGQFLPVIASDGTLHGVVIILHDVSGEESLERRLEKLHERVVLDPLTQIANRAEFERAHERFVETHLAEGRPYSLVICDLDHFKSINDTFGHQAGDQAIQSFAGLLKRLVRAGDLVARYGGEEFVILCCNCNLSTAAERAEQLRRELENTPQPMLHSRPITASFGVTEIQPGDTHETMLHRADRALLRAKELGRNMVVQVGTGLPESGEPIQENKKPSHKTVWGWYRRDTGDLKVESTLAMTVPLEIAVQKLRGFVADHRATLDRVRGRNIVLSLHRFRSRGHQSAQPLDPLVLEMEFSEESGMESQGGGLPRSRVRVVITPKTRRGVDREEFKQQARQVLTSLRAYLMAMQEATSAQAM